MRLAAAAALAVALAATAAAAPIKYLSYGEIVARLHSLRDLAPHLVTVFSAQDEFGVPSPGDCTDVAPQARTPCKQWFIRITNNATSRTDAMRGLGLEQRPQIFLSGNLHGDEQVGPMTLIHLVEDLVRARLAGDNPWLNMLVDTRVIVAVPMTNPWGYDRVVRTENNDDPNRDFPFDTDPTACMKTTAARAVNEVWRTHLFTGGLTFHGGMQAIAYEWGSFNHAASGSESPDDAAQASLASIMREAAGSMQAVDARTGRYPVGRMNALVYPVRGGMEDWAYGGSWDASAVPVCTPATYGGYAADKTRYNGAVLRAFNVLVETSDDKRPAEVTLGSHPEWPPASTPEAAAATSAKAGDILKDVLTVQGPGDGHVPRNMRLALSYIDMLQPYVAGSVVHASVVKAAAGSASSQGASGSAAAPAVPAASGSVTAAEHHTPLDPSSSDECAVHDADGRVLQQHRQEAPTPQLLEAATTRSTAATASNSGLFLASFPFDGPAACVEGSSGGAGASCGREHHAAYSQWMHTSSLADSTGVLSASGSILPAADADMVGVWAGWDVGGAFSVDETSVLVGTWDVRVPPSALSNAFVIPGGDEEGVPRSLAASAAGERHLRAADGSAAARATPVGVAPAYAPIGVPVVPRLQFELTLQAQYGLSPAEATTLAKNVVVWQHILLGQMPLAAVPPHMLVRHSASRTGVSRWAFGEAGAQPASPRKDSAFVPQSTAADNSEATVVTGAPRLASAPFVSRFSDCFLLPLPRPPAAAAVTSASIGSSQNGPATVAQGYILLPYALVDQSWRNQQAPDPRNSPPQSHWVNARFKREWRQTNENWVVQGRLHAVGEPQFVAVVHTSQQEHHSASAAAMRALGSTGSVHGEAAPPVARLLLASGIVSTSYVCNDGRQCPVASVEGRRLTALLDGSPGSDTGMTKSQSFGVGLIVGFIVTACLFFVAVNRRKLLEARVVQSCVDRLDSCVTVVYSRATRRFQPYEPVDQHGSDSGAGRQRVSSPP